MKKLITNLIVRIDKSIWYDFKLIAESMEMTNDRAFEKALQEFVLKNKSPEKLQESL